MSQLDQIVSLLEMANDLLVVPTKPKLDLAELPGGDVAALWVKQTGAVRELISQCLDVASKFAKAPPPVSAAQARLQQQAAPAGDVDDTEALAREIFAYAQSSVKPMMPSHARELARNFINSRS